MKSILCLLTLSLLPFARADKPWLPDLSSGSYEKPLKGNWYIDYENGSDEADGRSADTAFKHCPGDAAAVGKAAAAKLSPGDVVIFKGGVSYRGQLKLNSSGTEDAPVTLDGNTAGTFGSGPAIIEGGTAVPAWRPAAPEDGLGDHPHLQKLRIADLPRHISWQTLNLASESRPFPVAQEPDPSDSLFQEEPDDYFKVDARIAHSAPLSLRLEEGTRGNSQRPLLLALPSERGSAVVSPVVGAAFTAELKTPATVTRLGIMIQPNYTPVKELIFEADGKEVLKVELKKDVKELQLFDLPSPLTFQKLTFRFLSVHGEMKHDWTAIAQIAAVTDSGDNVFDVKLGSYIQDPANLTAGDAEAYSGMTVGFHAGANFIHYSPVTGFEPASGKLSFPFFGQKLYKTTKYCLLNGVGLIDQPGEYAALPGPNGKGTRIVFFPPEDVRLDEVTYSEGRGGFEMENTAHVRLQGFLIRRQGKSSAIRLRNARDVVMRDCQVHLVRAGSAVYAGNSEDLVFEGGRITECPGHTKGLVFQKSRNVAVRNTRFHRTTSTALDYYTCTDGEMTENHITEIKGMHANGLTLYLGCENIVVKGNVVTDGNCALTFQQAENLTFERNVLHGGNRSMAVGIWNAKPLKNIRFIRNTIVGGVADSDWQVGIFSINKSAENLVIENNILDGVSGEVASAAFRGNAYLRHFGKPKLEDEAGAVLLENTEGLFVNPDAYDFRLRDGSGLRGVGAYGE